MQHQLSRVRAETNPETTATAEMKADNGRDEVHGGDGRKARLRAQPGPAGCRCCWCIHRGDWGEQVEGRILTVQAWLLAACSPSGSWVHAASLYLLPVFTRLSPPLRRLPLLLVIPVLGFRALPNLLRPHRSLTTPGGTPLLLGGEES